MTILAGNSQIPTNRSKSKREMDINRCIKSKSRSEITKSHHNDTESDTSISPINEFSNMSTYRVPTKSRGGKRLMCLWWFWFCFDALSILLESQNSMQIFPHKHKTMAAFDVKKLK